MSKRGSTRGSVRFNKGATDMSNTPRNSFYGPNIPPPRGSIYGASIRDPMYNFNKMSMRGHGSMRGPGSQRNRGSFRCNYIRTCVQMIILYYSTTVEVLMEQLFPFNKAKAFLLKINNSNTLSVQHYYFRCLLIQSICVVCVKRESSADVTVILLVCCFLGCLRRPVTLQMLILQLVANCNLISKPNW